MNDATDDPGTPSDALAVPSPVVGPDWLETRLGAPGLHLIDMRQVGAFERSHIPGAVHLDLARLGTSEPGLDNVLLLEDPFAALMEELGVSAGGIVVVYDDQWGLAAARLLWALHYYGHDDVAVLDGGWDRWSEEGRPTTETPVVPGPGSFVARTRAEVFATGDWLAGLAEDEEVMLVDTRTSTEFEQGHLPGARSWDWFNAVPPGSWDVARDLDVLRSEWIELGLEPRHEIVVYCRSGMRAAHTYMVLRLAGYERVRLYDGSWQEWSMRQGGSRAT